MWRSEKSELRLFYAPSVACFAAKKQTKRLRHLGGRWRATACLEMLQRKSSILPSISSHPQDHQTSSHTARACMASDLHYVWHYARRTVFHSLTDPLRCTARVCVCVWYIYMCVCGRGGILWALCNRLHCCLHWYFHSAIWTKHVEAELTFPALQSALVTWARHEGPRLTLCRAALSRPPAKTLINTHMHLFFFFFFYFAAAAAAG